MTEAMAIAKVKSMAAELAWALWLGLCLGVGFALAWWVL